MLRFVEVRDYVEDGLEALGYEDTTAPSTRTMPRFDPGPLEIERLRQISPGPTVFLTVGNGGKMQVEGLFDRTFITARVIGPQHDFDGAEQLAIDLDRLLLEVQAGYMGDSYLLFVNRTGGPPALVSFDAGERYHYQTTYITEVTR
ncbi:MAG: hypothetical protein ACRDQA_22895 [Nocardioidaceae bacterium]